MPDYYELRTEDVWNNQFTPSALADLREAVLSFYSWDGWRIGIMGDDNHTWGYHRSRAWIQQSDFCTNRTASVTETEGNRTGGNPNAVAGMDLIINEVAARAMYVRINTAKAAGLLPELRQVILESGPWHVHLSFDRGHLEGGYQLLYQLITNQTAGSDKMIVVQASMPELRKGSKGSHVKTWQTLCNLRGGSLSVDGDFGPITEGTTKWVQSHFGAESVDGIVGPETWVIGLAAEDQV